MAVKYWTFLLLVLVLVGCATSSVETRRKERQAVYDTLPPDQKALVDQGELKVGMSEDVVYIALGKPNEILKSGDQNGEATTWIYYGSYMQGYPVWWRRNFTYAYNPQDYVKAELIFVKGKLVSWRTLPMPLN
jgi:outer membrane protein assembly factor BamE (lipoprotein component of BamABCDE complex)